MITENLDLFFADFGVSFIAGAISGMCLKDMPGMNILGDQVILIDHQVLVRTDEFGDLLYGNNVEVNGVAFIVKDAPMPVDDGAFSVITLEKAADPIPPTLILDGNDGGNEFIFDGND